MTQDAARTLLLIDGSSYLYRAYHAMPDLRAVPGDPTSPATGAIRGMINMIQSLKKEVPALYAACAACHGPMGQGNPELNAPKLAGQEPWYIERQLRNFQQKVRGAHEGDIYGAQMLPFAGMLADAAAVRDVAAYIGSLGRSGGSA